MVDKIVLESSGNTRVMKHQLKQSLQEKEYLL